MVIALGIDLVEVARISEVLERFPSFADRILHPDERGRPITAEYLAGRWAAKEAVKKCCPWIQNWHQAVVISKVGGGPVATVQGLPETEQLLISITHERTHAAAVAIRTVLPKP